MTSENIPQDNGDAKHDDSLGLDPELQKEALLMGLEVWSKKIIDDDDLFRVIQAKLSEVNESEGDLPDFSIQPTMKYQEDGTRLWSMLITKSVTKASQGVGIGFARFQHIPVAVFNPERNVFGIDPTFQQAVAGDEIGSEANERAQLATDVFLGQTMSMINRLTDRGVDLAFNPFTHQLQTFDELSRMDYVAEDQVE